MWSAQRVLTTAVLTCVSSPSESHHLQRFATNVCVRFGAAVWPISRSFHRFRVVLSSFAYHAHPLLSYPLRSRIRCLLDIVVGSAFHYLSSPSRRISFAQTSLPHMCYFVAGMSTCGNSRRKNANLCPRSRSPLRFVDAPSVAVRIRCIVIRSAASPVLRRSLRAFAATRIGRFECVPSSCASALLV